MFPHIFEVKAERLSKSISSWLEKNYRDTGDKI